MDSTDKTDKRVGTVQVYTGNGKGKTTAAVGQAIRAIGHGAKVVMIQFMKGSWNYGELIMASKIPNFTVIQYGRDVFVNKHSPHPVDIKLAWKGLKKAERIMENGECDMLILDEVNVAMDFHLLRVEDVLTLIDKRPRHMELVLTGRYAPQAIIDQADLVTEMQEVKHHYQKGITAREGIEY